MAKNPNEKYWSVTLDGIQLSARFWANLRKKEGSDMKVSLGENASMYRCPVDKKAKFAIVCPGGGYVAVAWPIEGLPVAKRLNELGYHAFVVNYRSGKNALAPNPIEDVMAALRTILAHAEEWNVEPEDYLLVGFSAGGHLAAICCTAEHGFRTAGLPDPAALALAYPVVTMGEKTHEQSRQYLLGKDAVNDPERLRRFSVETLIDPQFPPTYLWQCERDSTVPFENSQMLKTALDEQGVSCIYQTYDSSVHGWGLARKTPAEGWVDRAAAFWEENCR